MLESGTNADSFGTKTVTTFFTVSPRATARKDDTLVQYLASGRFQSKSRAFRQLMNYSYSRNSSSLH